MESASWSRGPRRAGPEHVSVKDKQQLRLLVGNAGDGGTCDHADWADARLE
ncbi:NPCBM/NEW2 domain-containing protein [Archangium violaceum]|uniref:NPCBM/NEW2 domain-containing protein n=1 Tax=Archangium violaceum TaxID=83451 RepID=UPI0037BE6AFD